MNTYKKKLKHGGWILSLDGQFLLQRMMRLRKRRKKKRKKKKRRKKN